MGKWQKLLLAPNKQQPRGPAPQHGPAQARPPTHSLTFAAPLARPLGEAQGFCLAMEGQTDSTSNMLSIHTCTSHSISCVRVASHRDARSVPLPRGVSAGLELTQPPDSLEMIDTPKVATISHTGRSGHGIVNMRPTAETQRGLGHLLQQSSNAVRGKDQAQQAVPMPPLPHLHPQLRSSHPHCSAEVSSQKPYLEKETRPEGAGKGKTS